jgi:acyl-CoA hydrolase
MTITDIAEHDDPMSSPNPVSHTTIRHVRVEPSDVGVLGFVDGGTLFEGIHDAGHATATRWSGRRCVAASLGNFHLDRPICVGELVEVRADLVHTGSSSLHVLVTVYTAHPAGTSGQTSQCPVVFVAVDDAGNPVPVSPWTPVTMLELQRQRQARHRIRMRQRIDNAIATQSGTAEGVAPCTTERFVVSQADVDRGEAVSGGRIMRWIDDAANTCGANWSAVPGLTSYVAAIRFRMPIVLGDQIEVSARLMHTGPRSMHIRVQVTLSDMVGGPTSLAAEGLIVVVTLDERGNARPVPKWTPLCDEDHQLGQLAQHMVELRQFFEPYSTATAIS